METWLTQLLEDLATRPSIGTADRHDLLVDVLALLGPIEADAYANSIEEHGYWVRHSNHQTGADRDLADAVHTAVFAVAVQIIFGQVAA